MFFKGNEKLPNFEGEKEDLGSCSNHLPSKGRTDSIRAVDIRFHDAMYPFEFSRPFVVASLSAKTLSFL